VCSSNSTVEKDAVLEAVHGCSFRGGFECRPTLAATKSWDKSCRRRNDRHLEARGAFIVLDLEGAMKPDEQEHHCGVCEAERKLDMGQGSRESSFRITRPHLRLVHSDASRAPDQLFGKAIPLRTE